MTVLGEGVTHRNDRRKFLQARLKSAEEELFRPQFYEIKKPHISTVTFEMIQERQKAREDANLEKLNAIEQTNQKRNPNR